MLIKYIFPQIPFPDVSSFNPTLTQHRLFLCLLLLLLPLLMKWKVKQRERKSVAVRTVTWFKDQRLPFPHTSLGLLVLVLPLGLCAKISSRTMSGKVWNRWSWWQCLPADPHVLASLQSLVFRPVESGLAVHAHNAGTLHAEAGGLQWVPGQPGWHCKTASQKGRERGREEGREGKKEERREGKGSHGKPSTLAEV